MIKFKKAYLVGAFFTLIFGSVVLASKNAFADISQINWPWSIAPFTAYTLTPINSIDVPLWCQSQVMQQKEIAGLSGNRDMCMMSSDSVRFGLYQQGSGLAAAISFGDDQTMHGISGICSLSDECLYLPGTDTLVRKEFLTGTGFRSLVLYKHFTQRLSQFINPLSLAVEYSFDSTTPDYIFSSDDKLRPRLIGGLGASTNGKWVALEFYKAGIGLLNVETLVMKKVFGLSYTYSVGSNPTTEFSVSNDGAHLVVMGRNAGLHIVDIDPGCGDVVNDSIFNSTLSVNGYCHDARFTVGFSGFDNGYLPKFSDDGGELGFYSQQINGDLLQVVLRAYGYAHPKLDYLALGDSYSSGEGETDDNKYIVGTNVDHEKCHTSTRSYPFLIASAMGIGSDLMESVACSGAKTIDLIGSADSYLGQGDRLGVGHLNLNSVDLLAAKTVALSNFIPGRILQSDFASEYRPKVITVGIGGNDAGFMEKLTACLSPSTCTWAATDKGKEQTAVEIKNLFTPLVQTYTQIHDKSPNSKIYAIGYPKIIDENGQCGDLVGLLFDAPERKFIVENIRYLNQVVASAAAAAGIEYVDIYDSFGNHALCGSDPIGAMNAVALGNDIGLMDNGEWLRFIGQESFHPNPYGHSLTAAKIISQIGNLLTYNYCSGLLICPGSSIIPEPSAELLPSGYHNYPLQKSVTFASVVKPTAASQNTSQSSAAKYKISMPSSTFNPSTSVSFKVDGNYGPYLARSFASLGDGSLEAIVDVPDGIEELYLVLHLIGKSYSGQDVDYYQSIRYFLPDLFNDEVTPPDDEENEDEGDGGLTEIVVPIYIPPTVTPVTPPVIVPVITPVVPSDVPIIDPTITPSITPPVPVVGVLDELPITAFEQPDSIVVPEPKPSYFTDYAIDELAVVTGSPEVKGAATIKKSVVKNPAKTNNYLRDWVLPRLGLGLLVAVILALIIIKIKKLKKRKTKK